MEIVSVDERLLFREKLRNQQIAGTVYGTGQLALIGISHG
jgi:hypothetical protein